MKIGHSIGDLRAFALDNDIHFGFGETAIDAMTDAGIPFFTVITDLIDTIARLDDGIDSRYPFHAAGVTMRPSLSPYAPPGPNSPKYVVLGARDGESNRYAYPIAMHEFGHAMLDHRADGQTLSPRALLQQEMDAWSWAVAHADTVDAVFKETMHASLNSYRLGLGLDDVAAFDVDTLLDAPTRSLERSVQ